MGQTKLQMPRFSAACFFLLIFSTHTNIDEFVNLFVTSSCRIMLRCGTRAWQQCNFTFLYRLVLSASLVCSMLHCATTDATHNWWGKLKHNSAGLHARGRIHNDCMNSIYYKMILGCPLPCLLAHSEPLTWPIDTCWGIQYCNINHIAHCWTSMPGKCRSCLSMSWFSISLQTWGLLTYFSSCSMLAHISTSVFMVLVYRPQPGKAMALAMTAVFGLSHTGEMLSAYMQIEQHSHIHELLVSGLVTVLDSCQLCGIDLSHTKLLQVWNQMEPDAAQYTLM